MIEELTNLLNDFPGPANSPLSNGYGLFVNPRYISFLISINLLTHLYILLAMFWQSKFCSFSFWLWCSGNISHCHQISEVKCWIFCWWWTVHGTVIWWCGCIIVWWWRWTVADSLVMLDSNTSRRLPKKCVLGHVRNWRDAQSLSLAGFLRTTNNDF